MKKVLSILLFSAISMEEILEIQEAWEAMCPD